MEDADRIRDTADKLGRNDRNELRLALDFEGGKSEVGEDSIPELYLSPARRQKLQKLGVIERVDTAREYYQPRRCPLSPFGRRVAEFLRAEHDAWAAERDRVKAAIRTAKKQLQASGDWGDLVAQYPVLKRSLSDASEKRLGEMHALLKGLCAD